MCTYSWLIHFLMQQKLHNTVKQFYSNVFKSVKFSDQKKENQNGDSFVPGSSQVPMLLLRNMRPFSFMNISMWVGFSEKLGILSLSLICWNFTIMWLDADLFHSFCWAQVWTIQSGGFSFEFLLVLPSPLFTLVCLELLLARYLVSWTGLLIFLPFISSNPSLYVLKILLSGRSLWC